MNSSKSSPKRAVKASFKPVAPFQLFYQLTYMSAMASAGITRSKTFELAAKSESPVSVYFEAINTLVTEMRFDYPEACRRVGQMAKSENMKSFLLRFSDALRSGEPLADFLGREAEAQGEDYQNRYERDLEGLKQWTNAFSSIVISVALIIIIQMISAMIYSMDVVTMTSMMVAGLMFSGLGTWIIFRSAPREVMTVSPRLGSAEQQRALKLFRIIAPLASMMAVALAVLGLDMGFVLMGLAVALLPIGIAGFLSDRKTVRKDLEFSTFLRSTGGMASSSGTTLKQALTKIDLSSFPTMETDIDRLSTRLQALVDPEICWKKFGQESGSKLISEVTDIFYSAIQIGGEPERVGYFCSLFAAKTTQLRAKRRLTAGTFAGLTTVMQAVVAGLMVFILSIVKNFAEMVKVLMADTAQSMQGSSLSFGIVNMAPGDVQFLSTVTIVMIVLLALVGATAIILCDGGYKLKGFFYLSLTVFVSGICFIAVPPVVAGIFAM